MNELLATLLNWGVLVFAVSSMLSVGFGHGFAEILQPLRSIPMLVRALLANFVAVPLLAIVVLRLLDPAPELAVGLFLVATAAGAPFLIKLAEVAETDVAMAASLLVLLLPATIFYMPIVVPLALPEVHVSAVAIAMPLLLTMLLPLALGLIVRAWATPLAERLQPLMGKLSSFALLLLVIATVLSNVDGIVAVFRTTAILAALIVIAGAFGAGYLLGGDERRGKEILGLATSQRNIAAAMVVATEAIGDPGSITMVVVTSLVAFFVLFPVAGLMRRYGAARTPRAS